MENGYYLQVPLSCDIYVTTSGMTISTRNKSRPSRLSCVRISRRMVTAVTDERKIAETFGSVPFLKKPFSIENLRRKVNQVLTGQMVGQ